MIICQLENESKRYFTGENKNYNEHFVLTQSSSGYHAVMFKYFLWPLLIKVGTTYLPLIFTSSNPNLDFFQPQQQQQPQQKGNDYWFRTLVDSMH